MEKKKDIEDLERLIAIRDRVRKREKELTKRIKGQRCLIKSTERTRVSKWKAKKDDELNLKYTKIAKDFCTGLSISDTARKNGVSVPTVNMAKKRILHSIKAWGLRSLDEQRHKLREHFGIDET